MGAEFLRNALIIAELRHFSDKAAVVAGGTVAERQRIGAGSDGFVICKVLLCNHLVIHEDPDGAFAVIGEGEMMPFVDGQVDGAAFEHDAVRLEAEIDIDGIEVLSPCEQIAAVAEIGLFHFPEIMVYLLVQQEEMVVSRADRLVRIQPEIKGESALRREIRVVSCVGALPVVGGRNASR